jgi:hypothetical protein
VDSNGQRIGYYAGLDNAHMSGTVVSISGEEYFIATARLGFSQPGEPTIYTENADCSGQQYLGDSNLGIEILPHAFLTTDGFFHYAPASQMAEVLTNGQRNLHFDGTLGPCMPAASSEPAAPHLTVQAPAFTPPFLVVDAYPISPAPGTATFNDVPTTHPFFQFIEALHASGITGGCQASPPLYCPDDSVTRGQMAVFLAKALGL